jgi:hypothetical protein
MSLGSNSSAAAATADPAEVLVEGDRSGVALGQDLGKVVPWAPYWVQMDLLEEREI